MIPAGRAPAGRVNWRKVIFPFFILNVDNALIVVPDNYVNLSKSSRNVPGFKVLPAGGVNVYDILLHKHVVLLQTCLGQLEERLLS